VSEESITPEIKTLKLTTKSVSINSNIKNNQKDLLTKRVSVDFNKFNKKLSHNISLNKFNDKII